MTTSPLAEETAEKIIKGICLAIGITEGVFVKDEVWQVRREKLKQIISDGVQSALDERKVMKPTLPA
jgi:hypothetical protein